MRSRATSPGSRSSRPAPELPFAGHPTVGTSWLLTEFGRKIWTIRVPAGDVETWRDGELTWIRARAEWVHKLDVRQYPTVEKVDALRPGRLGIPGCTPGPGRTKSAGRLRSRYFPTDLGIVEDEATGAAAVVMGDRLGRPLTIRQGVGSRADRAPGSRRPARSTSAAVAVWRRSGATRSDGSCPARSAGPTLHGRDRVCQRTATQRGTRPGSGRWEPRQRRIRCDRPCAFELPGSLAAAR